MRCGQTPDLGHARRVVRNAGGYCILHQLPYCALYVAVSVVAQAGTRRLADELLVYDPVDQIEVLRVFHQAGWQRFVTGVHLGGVGCPRGDIVVRIDAPTLVGAVQWAAVGEGGEEVGVWSRVSNNLSDRIRQRRREGRKVTPRRHRIIADSRAARGDGQVRACPRAAGAAGDGRPGAVVEHVAERDGQCVLGVGVDDRNVAGDTVVLAVGGLIHAHRPVETGLVTRELLLGCGA